MASNDFTFASPRANTTPWSHRHAAKEKLRQSLWRELQQQGAVKHDPVGHIPNFVGAEAAADRLATLPIWRSAQVIKCNPDSPQQPVRLKALVEGKVLYMAVPQLAQVECFVEVTAASLAAQGLSPEAGASMAGALRHGRWVRLEAMQAVDLVLVGCVAVTAAGGRMGKGAGFADLELAMLHELGRVQPQTPIATTVHELQVVDDRVGEKALTMQAHDWPLDWIVTPTRSLATHTTLLRPPGIDWASLQPDQLAQIPILQKLRQVDDPRNET